MRRDTFGSKSVRLVAQSPARYVVLAIVAISISGVATAQDTPRRRIEQKATALGYSDNTVQLLLEVVGSWKDTAGHAYFEAFARNLSAIEEGCKQGWASRECLVDTQIETVRALGQCIENAFLYETDYFDLPNVLEGRKANCFGYAQLLTILGDAVGLSVRVVAVTESEASSPASGPGHIANIVDMADGTVVYVDLTRGADCVSEPFEFQIDASAPDDETSVGATADRRTVPVLDERVPLAETLIVWAQNRSGTPISVDSKRLDVLDGNDLVAEIHFSRGTVANLAGRSAEAIGHYSKAIALSPHCARAYNNRGAVYLLQQEYEMALIDFGKAIEIDPTYVQAWQNRGSAYLGLGRYEKAIDEYTEAIRLAPSMSDPFFCRGYARVQVNRYAEGIDDYTRAIALDPFSARTLYRRGIAYARAGDDEKARADLTRAVELDRTVADSVAEVSRHFDLGLSIR